MVDSVLLRVVWPQGTAVRPTLLCLPSFKKILTGGGRGDRRRVAVVS